MIRDTKPTSSAATRFAWIRMMGSHGHVQDLRKQRWSIASDIVKDIGQSWDSQNCVAHGVGLDLEALFYHTFAVPASYSTSQMRPVALESSSGNLNLGGLADLEESISQLTYRTATRTGACPARATVCCGAWNLVDLVVGFKILIYTVALMLACYETGRSIIYFDKQY